MSKIRFSEITEPATPSAGTSVIYVDSADGRIKQKNDAGDVYDITFSGNVDSVFGRTGIIVAQAGDYTTSLVTEGSNLYYTEARVSANTNVAANTTHRTSDGSDHTFINQDVRTTATPTFSNVISTNNASSNNHVPRWDQVTSLVAGLSWQEPVIAQQPTPPVTPNTGDRYIVTATATGDWTGQEDDIAEWNGASWDFSTPTEGWTVWDQTLDTNYTFNSSSWVEFGSTVSHNNTTGLQGGTTNQYFHLTNTQYSNFISKEGTPANDQLGVWTGDGTIEGATNVTYDGNKLSVASGQIHAAQGTTLTPAGTTQTIDFNNGNAQVLDLGSATGDVTLTLSNAQAGGSYLIKIIQGTTSRNVVLPSAVLMPGGTSPNTLIITAIDNAVDTLVLYYDGTNYIGQLSQNYG